ncbi:hypothetical protein K470DRAFT_243785 [Piedraia hortae CBS 480.64]|uniref:SURP motif domain-containing protein n=1 Tax=Piedraia hortae CBS 480.64 TaxID=1314780 RepID=A0A6A7C546_9PEZI|nr:hypothetical protein K470DRAFT_243785 [Piedraia hortae CBS 480.64]
MAAPTTTTLNDESFLSQVPKGTILPPHNQREIIETTAGYVARNGASFEERLRKSQSNSKVAFLDPGDAYHPYYQWRLSEIKAGRGTATSAGRAHETGATGVSSKGREARKGPEKPPDFSFSTRMPNISAQDLEIVKLTALFVAKNGRGWMAQLSQKEAGNFQFDFLRPQHTLYAFFSRLVDQYQDLLLSSQTQTKRIAELEANVTNRFHVLERAKTRAEWLKYQETQKLAREEEEEKERIAFHSIDWQDFVVVETVLFEPADEDANLPAPPTKNDIQSASLEQKAAMSINPAMRIEEAMPTFEQVNLTHRPSQQQQQQQQQQFTPAQQSFPQQPSLAAMPPPPQPQPSQTVPQQPSPSPMQQQQDVKIRPTTESPIPRAQKKNTSVMLICPRCNQPVASDEMNEHMRIEMLDPRWQDQNRIAMQRSATTNLSTADMAGNLKRLASQRGDVFDNDGRKRR